MSTNYRKDSDRALVLTLASAALCRSFAAFAARRRPKRFTPIEADRAVEAARLAGIYLDKATEQLEKIEGIYRAHYGTPDVPLRVSA